MIDSCCMSASQFLCIGALMQKIALRMHQRICRFLHCLGDRGFFIIRHGVYDTTAKLERMLRFDDKY